MKNLRDFVPASDTVTSTPWSAQIGESWWIEELKTDSDVDLLIEDGSQVIFKGLVTSSGVKVDFGLNQLSKYQIKGCTTALHFSGLRRKALVK